jgi:transcriptional regulator with XRE-family HTH domain
MKVICPHCGTEFSTDPETAMGSARLAKGLSMRAAALRIGISMRQLTRIEKGTSHPTLSVARKISQLYGVPADELWPPEADAIDESVEIEEEEEDLGIEFEELDEEDE